MDLDKTQAWALAFIVRAFFAIDEPGIRENVQQDMEAFPDRKEAMVKIAAELLSQLLKLGVLSKP